MSSSDVPDVGDGGVDFIAAERYRQVNEEGWTPDHDDQHEKGELVRAAICYALANDLDNADIWDRLWPWDESSWKPTPDNRIRELSKAGALIAAEIDRLVRLGRASYISQEQESLRPPDRPRRRPRVPPQVARHMMRVLRSREDLENWWLRPVDEIGGAPADLWESDPAALLAWVEAQMAAPG